MKNNTSVYVVKSTKKIHKAATNGDRCRKSFAKKGNVISFPDIAAANAAGYFTKCGHCYKQSNIEINQGEGRTGEVTTM